MGTAFTCRLIEAGYSPFIWNRSPEKAAHLVAQGARWSNQPLAECDRVIISLYSSESVAEVIGSMKGDLRSGQLLIDTTTGEPEHVERMGNELLQMGVHYLDAPISGSSEQTRRGEAVVLVGGPTEVVDSCGDLWPVLGRTLHHCGPLGSASRMKLVTNLVLGLNRAALAEGLGFARSIGVNPTAALEVLRGSAAQSKVMDTKGEKMLQGDFSPQARLSQHRKDVEIIVRDGAAAGLDLPLSNLHLDLLREAEKQGLGTLDNSAIARLWGLGT
jgi:3-hydroxyisobutyrate dehydrogenase-like beta-hydroxyacid dehydrogenase